MKIREGFVRRKASRKQTLQEKYGIPREQVKADVDAFLKPLLEIGAVTE